MATADAAAPAAPDAPNAPNAPSAPPADDSRWPASIGIYVAIGGAALVAALWAIRQRKAVPAAPPDA